MDDAVLNSLAEISNALPKSRRVQLAPAFNAVLEALGSSLETHSFLIGGRPLWNNPKTPHQVSSVLNEPKLVASLGYIHNLSEHGNYNVSINELATFLRVTPRTIENRLKKAGKNVAQSPHRLIEEGLITFWRSTVNDHVHRKPFSEALAQFEKGGSARRGRY